MCVVLLYVDALCYVCYVPDVCRSVHTVFCLITTIIVILFKENVNLFRPTSYDIVRHLSENITTKKLLFLTITVGTTVFFIILCSADNPVQFHKIYYRLFSDLTDFLHVNGIHPALTRSECDRKKFDAASLLLINNSQKYIGKIKVLRNQMYVPGHRLCFHQTVRSVGICQIYPKTDTDNQFQSFVTKTRDIPSCLSFLQPMTISYFCLRFQNGSNSSGSVWPSESVWKM